MKCNLMTLTITIIVLLSTTVASSMTESELLNASLASHHRHLESHQVDLRIINAKLTNPSLSADKRQELEREALRLNQAMRDIEEEIYLNSQRKQFIETGHSDMGRLAPLETPLQGFPLSHPSHDHLYGYTQDYGDNLRKIHTPTLPEYRNLIAESAAEDLTSGALSDLKTGYLIASDPDDIRSGFNMKSLADQFLRGLNQGNVENSKIHQEIKEGNRQPYEAFKAYKYAIVFDIMTRFSELIVGLVESMDSRQRWDFLDKVFRPFPEQPAGYESLAEIQRNSNNTDGLRDVIFRRCASLNGREIFELLNRVHKLTKDKSNNSPVSKFFADTHQFGIDAILAPKINGKRVKTGKLGNFLDSGLKDSESAHGPIGPISVRIPITCEKALR